MTDSFSYLHLNFQRIFEIGPKLYVGLPGLATDTQTVAQRLKFRTNLYELQENRRIKPSTLTAMTSGLLYEKRFGYYFTEPVIAGLDEDNKPFIASMDLIGNTTLPEDFCVCGSGEEQVFGMCETLWKPDMTPDELFEILSQSLMNAAGRDPITGQGAIVYIIEKDKVTTRTLRMRTD